MKKISILIPTYNEENSIERLYQEIVEVWNGELSTKYEYEIIFCDNKSQDSTWEKIISICQKDSRCKAVLNARNFGFHRNVMESFKYAEGDAAILIFGDLQDPPKMIPSFVEKWECGYRSVVGQRSKTAEHGLKKYFREKYYDVMNLLGDKNTIHNMNGFGLYDRKFVDDVNRIEEVTPYLKNVIQEYGGDICVVPYEQNASARGKSNFNFWANYDFSMYGITSSTKMLMRIATFIGAFTAFFSFLLAAYVCIRKIIQWESYPFGSASIIVVVLFIGGIQLLFIGVLGEYVLTINERIARKPRCSIEEKVNFDE